MYDTAKDANSVKAMAEADANLNKALNILNSSYLFVLIK